MEQRLLYPILLLFFSIQSYAQQDTSIKYHPPLDIPLVLSANFGELRPNHFHMGLDFKTNGITGLKLYAIEEGYIARVKASPYGYGNVVYINHPNGVTSVYAHCSAFVGALDSIVKLTQEKEQNFEVEIFPKPNEIKVSKGEHFALSGNTGSSTAPHLHFELRDTKTESALNPLKFGFDIVDHLAPEIRNIKIYGLTNKGYLIAGKSKIIPVTKGKYGYYIGGNTTSIPSNFCTENGGVGFAFDVIDHYDQASNVLGLYGSYLIINNDTIFEQRMDSVSFDHTRYINSHTDYTEYKINKKKYHKAFRTKENPLAIYKRKDLGVIPFHPLDTFKVSYVAFDTKNNKSVLNFNINALAGPLHPESKFITKDYLFPDSTFKFENALFSIEVPEGCVYEPTPRYLKTGDPKSIGTSAVPIQKAIAVKLKLIDPKLPIEKYYIACNSAYLATKYNEEWLTAESKSLGTFTIKSDTTAPTIVPLNFLKTDTICKKPTLTWAISDGKTSLADYDLYIDGKWYLLEYESKGSYGFFRKPKDLTGKHLLRITAKDACGNVGSWEREMILDF